jgi:hypothetical protein
MDHVSLGKDFDSNCTVNFILGGLPLVFIPVVFMSFFLHLKIILMSSF